MEKRWVNKIVCVLAFFSLLSLSIHFYVSPSFFSTQAEEIKPSIRIINIQSYPKKGGYWTVTFTVEGTADLSIRAVEGTTWSKHKCSTCDLLFNSIRNEKETFDTLWKDDCVIIKNFSSSMDVYEISKVNTLGKHVLEFTFGNKTVYAYNDATNWWNNNWGFRKKIEINKSQVQSTLIDFPVLINISDSDLNQKAENDGHDIAFVSYSDNTTKYSHEIETYSEGNLTAWVKIPRLSSIENTSIWMYYNNSDSSIQENPSMVWDDNFVMIHHLEEEDIDGGVGDISDSTKNKNNGTTSGMDINDDIDAVVNGGFDFDGNNDSILIPYDSTLNFSGTGNELTLSAWINVQDLTHDGGIIGRWQGTGKHQYVLKFESSTNNIKFAVHDGEFKIAESFNNTIIQDTWIHVAGVGNGTNLSVYINGEQSFKTTPSYGNISIIGNDNLTIGEEGESPDNFFEGRLDELRLSTLKRNQSWIKTSYNTIFNQSNFIKLEKEESAAPTVSNPSPSDEDFFTPKKPAYFEITIFDPNPELMNITWRTNQSGTWETFNVTNGTGNGVNDGTYQVTNTSWATLFDHKYWWSINVTDGTHWTNETFSFAIHQFDPVINSFDLQNNSGSKLNNQTGCLDVGKEYIFLINVTDRNGWSDIDYINIASWYDQGDDTSEYNQTTGENYNMFLQYKNTTGTGQFTMIWPDDESTLQLTNCSEKIINQTTRIINISFIPGNQTHCATSNESWNNTENSYNDPYSWNLNCTIYDNLSNYNYYLDEYGINYYSALKAPELIEITGAPGMNEVSNIFTIDFISNADFRLKIYFVDNLTQNNGPDEIGIGGNLSLLKEADVDDDLLVNTTFAGCGEQHAIVLLQNRSASSQGTSDSVSVQFQISIPYGTWGTYSSRIIKKIERI